jgi:hypothetical protein
MIATNGKMTNEEAVKSQSELFEREKALLSKLTKPQAEAVSLLAALATFGAYANMLGATEQGAQSWETDLKRLDRMIKAIPEIQPTNL